MSEATMAAEPRAEQLWLSRMVGEWSCEMEAVMNPGEPPSAYTSRESNRALGPWVVCEGMMEEDGSPGSVMTLGFDPARGRFVGTFVVSMATHLWIYEGELEGDTLVLRTRGPGVADDAPDTEYRDTLEFRGPDERRLTSSYRDADGAWREFMTARYHRIRTS